MKNFVVYDSDGEILRTGRCADSDFDLQAGPGQSVMEGVADDSTQRVVAGAIVDKTSVFESEALVRHKRDQMLLGTDWTQVNDSPLSESHKLKYRNYRQALRDLTTHENWPQLNENDWPTIEV